jgi:hypothetical protein
VIDSDQTMQMHSNPDDYYVYSNDHVRIQSQCLTWTKPVTWDLVMRYGLPKDKSLQDIVSSTVQASTLGICSHCHHSDRWDPSNPYRPRFYAPLIRRDSDTYTVTSGATIGGLSWNGRNGSRDSWANRFTKSTFKQSMSPGMIAVFKQWIANGSPD